MDAQLVYCKKLGQNQPGLAQAPLSGPLGQILVEHVSEQAWNDWIETEMKIINEERLDLSEERSQERLFNAMIEYLNLEDVVSPNP